MENLKYFGLQNLSYLLCYDLKGSTINRFKTELKPEMT